MTASAGAFPERTWARVAGVLYLLTIGAGLFAQVFVRDRLVVSGNAAATAENIRAHEALFRLGIAADLSTYLAAIVISVILYALLRPVNRHVALAMLLFNVAQDAIGGMNAVNLYRVLQILTGAGAPGLGLEASQELALLSLRAHAFGFGVALAFFGCSCLALGHLAFYSRWIPRVLGVLIAVAGAAYLVNGGLLILAPARASIALLAPAFVGELALASWLVVRADRVSLLDAPARAPGSGALRPDAPR